MASIFQQKNRVVFPRWRDFKSTSLSGDIKPFVNKPVHDFSRNTIEDKILSWSHEKDLASAVELVNSAFNLGLYEESKEAAEFLLHKKKSHPIGLSKVINLTLGIKEVESAPFQNTIFEKDVINKYFKLQIGWYRKRLTSYPYNPIAWVELARLHAVVNNLSKAERALMIALHLAPDNRYVLRSLARFYVHSKQPDKAAYYLKKSDVTKHDPWLLSTQISVSNFSEGKNNILLKQSFQTLESKKFTDFDTNELASSLGTVELYNGASKNARKLFNKSLINPNDNSVAQASWASNHISGLIIQEKSFELPSAYEARALELFSQRKYNEALVQSVKWLLDEPFASRPARLSSHLAATYISDFKIAEEITRFALQTTPDDFELINNLVYSLCLDNKIAEAEQVYARVDYYSLNKVHQVVYTATSGLIEYRRGNPVQGKLLYETALQESKLLGQDYLHRLAMVNYVREELMANSDVKHDMEPIIKKLRDDSKEEQITLELDRIEQKLLGIQRDGNFTFL